MHALLLPFADGRPKVFERSVKASRRTAALPFGAAAAYGVIGVLARVERHRRVHRGALPERAVDVEVSPERAEPVHEAAQS